MKKERLFLFKTFMFVLILTTTNIMTFGHSNKNLANEYETSRSVVDELAFYALDIMVTYDKSVAETYHEWDSLKTLYESNPEHFRWIHKLKKNETINYMEPRPSWINFYDLINGKCYGCFECEQFSDKTLFDTSVGIYAASFACISDGCRVIIVKEGNIFSFFFVGGKVVGKQEYSQMLLYIVNLQKKHPNCISSNEVLAALDRLMGPNNGLNYVGEPSFQMQKTVGNSFFRTQHIMKQQRVFEQ